MICAACGYTCNSLLEQSGTDRLAIGYICPQCRTVELIPYATTNDTQRRLQQAVLVNNFKMSWDQAMTGKTRPLADILRELEDDDQ